MTFKDKICKCGHTEIEHDCAGCHERLDDYTMCGCAEFEVDSND